MKTPACIAIILATTGLIVPRVLAGTTYYISPAGDDHNDGKDPSTAWRSAGHVNAAKFASGDSILFRRGGEWHEQLIASSNGTAGQPITYADYGDATAADPTFWGSDIVPAAAFTSVGNSIYAAPVSSLPGHVAYCIFADHEFLHPYAGASNLPVKSFFVDVSTIYVNTGALDPTKGNPVITASDRAQGTAADSSLICSNGHDNLVFKNLIGRETAAATANDDVPDAYIFRIQGSSNIKIEHCEAFNGGKHHFGVINTTGFIGTHLHAAGCIPGLPFGHAGAFVSFSDESRHGDTSEWIDCTVDHFEPSQQSFITHGPGLGKLVIQKLTSIDCGLGIGTDNPNEIVIIKGGLLDAASCDIYGKNVVVDGMLITGTAKIDVFGDNNLVQNCIDDKSTNGEGGIICRGKENTIRLNTLSHRNGPCVDIKNTAERTQVVGNLFTGGARAINDDGSKESTASYNFYDNTQSPAAGLEIDKNLKQGDPMFVSLAVGYALQPASPAVNFVPASEIIEKNGQVAPGATAFNAGAFQHQDAP